MNRQIQFMLALTMLISPVLLSAEIYRCDDGDIVVFSDLPCAENAKRYAAMNRISIIEMPADLEAIAESTREIVAQRQQRREDARREQRLREQERARLSRSLRVETAPVIYQPFFNPINRPTSPPAPPRPQPDDRPIRESSRSAILSNRPSQTQRGILTARRDSP